MSFWTEFLLFHPGPFPVVTCADLARLWRLTRAGGLEARHSPSCRIAFGRMTRDNEPLDRWEGDMIRHCVEGHCDIQCEPSPHTTDDSILRSLDQHADQSVYRAHLTLGRLSREAVDRLHVRDARNAEAVALHTVGFSVDLVQIHDLDSDDVFVPSLMALSVSGQGYCYPRTAAEVLAALRAEPQVRSLEQIVQSIWPVTPTPASPEEKAERRAMGRLWLESPDRPRGWAWGYSSS